MSYGAGNNNLRLKNIHLIPLIELRFSLFGYLIAICYFPSEIFSDSIHVLLGQME